MPSDIPIVKVTPWLSEFGKSSYVWHGKDKSVISDLTGSAVLLAEFDLGPGNWILIAKAQIHAQGEGTWVVELILIATDGIRTDKDTSKASVSTLGYQTVSLILGTAVSENGNVKLSASVSGPEPPANLTDIVITAIKVDKLIVGKL